MRSLLLAIALSASIIAASPAFAQDAGGEMSITGVVPAGNLAVVRIESRDFRKLETRECVRTDAIADASLTGSKMRFSMRIPEACVSGLEGVLTACWMEDVERCQVIDFVPGSSVDLGELKYVYTRIASPDLGFGPASSSPAPSASTPSPSDRLVLQATGKFAVAATLIVVGAGLIYIWSRRRAVR